MDAAGDVGRLRTVLGIEAPILQSGMRGVAGPEPAASVRNAGGLGRVPCVDVEPGVPRRNDPWSTGVRRALGRWAEEHIEELLAARVGYDDNRR